MVNAVAAMLTKSPLCAGMPLIDLEALVCRAQRHTFDAGWAIYRQGDDARRLIMVQTGLVKTVRFTEAGDEILIDIHPPGEVFGMLNLHCPVHISGAAAVSKTTALSWRLSDLCVASSVIERNLAAIVHERLMEAELRFTEGITEHVASRLAKALMRLSAKAGDRIPLQREEVAQMVGSNMFTVSRIFTEWEAAGLISKGRGSVQVVDSERLMARVAA